MTIPTVFLKIKYKKYTKICSFITTTRELPHIALKKRKAQINFFNFTSN